MFTQWCSTPQRVVAVETLHHPYYGVVGWHLSCIIRDAVFLFEPFKKLDV